MQMLNVSVGEVVGELTLTVRLTGQRQFRARFWIARHMIALTALIIGTRFQIDADLS